MPTELFDPPRPKKNGAPKRKPGRPAMDHGQRLALMKIAGYSADAEKAIDDTVRLVEWTITALRNEITANQGARQQFVTKDDVLKLDRLTKMVESLVATKSKWFHLARAHGAGLTPDEVLEGAVQRILRQDTKTRTSLINRLVDGHNGKRMHDAQYGLKRVDDASVPTVSEPLPPKPSGPALPRTAVDAIAALAVAL